MTKYKVRKVHKDGFIAKKNFTLDFWTTMVDLDIPNSFNKKAAICKESQT